MIYVLELAGGPRDGEKLEVPSNIASVELAGPVDLHDPDPSNALNLIRYQIDGKWILDGDIYRARFVYEVPA